MAETLKITKSTMEVLRYLFVCFQREVITIDSGGYSDSVYKRALRDVGQIPFASEFIIVLPDGTEKKFRQVPDGT